MNEVMPLKQMWLIFSLQPLSRSIKISVWCVWALFSENIMSSEILQLFGGAQILKYSNVFFFFSLFFALHDAFNSSGDRIKVRNIQYFI